ncbi:hypothetical protein TIFTF001_011414 [Ficus carica]|uniref:Uncharacterized protein n=1 Tax=Ficus carica TaxID=3494 RepID=A0AA87ZYM3_FICCA|nr:hypothetical protein TIFTF001_011414 [Ficus carica]
MSVFYTVIRCLWQRRNKWILKIQMLTATETVAWTERFLSDFLVCNGFDKPTEKKTLAPKVPWRVPSHDQVKINVDAVIDSSLEYIGIRVIARVKYGFVMSFLARQIFGGGVGCFERC